MKAFFIVCSLLILGGCASVVDVEIPVDSKFSERADKILLQQPRYFVTDKAYNMRLDEYQVQNSHISSFKKDKKLLDVRRHSTSWLNFLLYREDHTYIEEYYEVSGFQEFSFSLVKDHDVKTQSNCQRFTQSERNVSITEHDHHGRYSRDWDSFDSRLQTYFVCKIIQNNESIKFSLRSDSSGFLSIQLVGVSMPFELKTMEEQFLLIKSRQGIERRERPPWQKNTSAIVISLHGEKQAIISTVGHSKIWIRKDVKGLARELLLTVAYNLSLLNWIDKDWNQTGRVN